MGLCLKKSGEVDAAVFRQQYIPQTLEQVNNAERDAEKLRSGQGDDLVYRDLLADKAGPQVSGEPGIEEERESDKCGSISGSEDGSESEAEEAGEGDATGAADPFAKKKPRGKTFEDKEAKRQHKRQVKEEKREQRAKKMPKHIKKRLVNTTKRR
ncbi:hypothetical protein VTN96DRAFT_1926 [Rasamsonia emersonii]